jgi:hypothetical protein
LETPRKIDGEVKPIEAGDDTSSDLLTPMHRLRECQFDEPEVELVYMPAHTALNFMNLQSDEKPKTLKRQNSSPSKMTSPQKRAYKESLYREDDAQQSYIKETLSNASRAVSEIRLTIK